MNNVIYHHGIKGQKWGIRRSPEELGHMKKTVESVSTLNSKTASVFKKIDTMSSNAKSQKQYRKLGERYSKEAIELTDKELRDALNRLNMEEQYNRLTGRDGASRARITKEIGEALEVLGDVAAIGGAAISIMIAIKKLKG